MSNGKGDAPRPISVDRELFENNWERVFGRKGTTEEIDNTINQLNDLLPPEMQDMIMKIQDDINNLSISIKEKNDATSE